MNPPNRELSSALVVGAVIGVGIHWLVGQILLAVVTAVTWVTAFGLTLHIRRAYPAFSSGESWADKRWTGLAVAVVTLAALIGAGPALPVSADVRFVLGLLVLGASVTAYSAGTLAVLDRVELDSNTTESPRVSDVADDD
ncbi:sterol desaturase [Halorhabdus sp. BNX81]|uniref:sterol desaturase n=1 Tax=Halorhabdus sp. BNX81 TaxID=2980181 RepID=UPI0023DD24D4|nr:sterol desaturase [Halorhabdus sp. BNX81]WEL21026.1 putative membrane protein [Halorhabdus sp. BNX81]